MSRVLLKESGCYRFSMLLKIKIPAKSKISFRVQFFCESKWRQTLSFSIFLFDQKSISQIIRRKRRQIIPACPRFFHTVNPENLTLQPLNIDSIPVHYWVISLTIFLVNILVIFLLMSLFLAIQYNIWHKKIQPIIKKPLKISQKPTKPQGQPLTFPSSHKHCQCFK